MILCSYRTAIYPGKLKVQWDGHAGIYATSQSKSQTRDSLQSTQRNLGVHGKPRIGWTCRDLRNFTVKVANQRQSSKYAEELRRSWQAKDWMDMQGSTQLHSQSRKPETVFKVRRGT